MIVILFIRRFVFFDEFSNKSQIFQYVRMSGGVLSVVLFLAVLFIYRRQRAAVADKDSQSAAAKKQVKCSITFLKFKFIQATAQARMTKTIGLSSIFTFICFVIPSFVKLWLEVYVPGGQLNNQSINQSMNQ